MSKRTFELTYDQIEQIFVEEIEWQLHYIDGEIANFKSGVFVHQGDIDRYLEDRVALKRVLGMYKA